MQAKSTSLSFPVPSFAKASPFKLLAATVTLALAAGVAQTAIAEPGPGYGRGGHDGHGMMMMGGHRMDRALAAVNATPEQRAQIKQIFDAARADLKGQRDAGRTLREQSAALFAQPVVDARAAEVLRTQMVAQHDAASKRMLQAMLDASRVLTPEQRKLLADKMAQRRTMMERHHAERAAMNKAGR